MSHMNCERLQKAKKEEKSEKKCLTKKGESSIIYELSRRRHRDQRLGQAPKKLFKKVLKKVLTNRIESGIITRSRESEAEPRGELIFEN